MDDLTPIALVGATLVPGGTMQQSPAWREEAHEVWGSDITMPPEGAAHAVVNALQAAHVTADAVQHLWYAWTHHQGHHFWSPAHAVAELSGCSSAVPVGLQQMCNGAAAALEICHNSRGTVSQPQIIATGDCFREPSFDRWAGDYGVTYADAFLAAVVQPESDVAPGITRSRVEALSSVALPHLHSMHHNPAGPVMDVRDGWPVDTRGGKKNYLRLHGRDALQDALGGAVRAAASTALAAAPHLNGEVFVPRLEQRTIDSLYTPVIHDLLGVTPTAGARFTGHLGAGDLLAHVHDIQALARQSPSPRTDLVISVGAGFTVTAVVLTTSTRGVA